MSKGDERPVAIARPKIEPSAGDHVRIALKHSGAWRPVFWFKVQADGSAEMGPRFRPDWVRTGESAREGNRITTSLVGGEDVTPSDKVPRVAFSLDIAGVMSATHDQRRVAGEPLTTLTTNRLLCFGLLAHPTAFAPTTEAQRRKPDIHVPYPVDEQRPIFLQLYAWPEALFKPIIPRSAVYAMNVVFTYHMPEVVMQVVLSHGPIGPWPRAMQFGLIGQEAPPTS